MTAPGATGAELETAAPSPTGGHARGLALFLAGNALAAAGGGVALVVGGIDLGAEVTGRLPFASPVLAGIALTLVVAVPLGLAAGAAWRGEPETADLLVGAGVLLVGWIAVQLVFIRSFSPFQPLYAAIGAGLLATGERMLRAGAPPPGRPRSVPVSALRCAVATVGLLARHRLRLRGDRVGTTATLPDGRSFTVFRESSRWPDRAPVEPVELAVWFHLRGVPAEATLRRRLFQRLCLVNTLLFAGCSGFLVKRWLVDDRTSDWAGLYTWDTAEAADRYGRYITAVLRPVSTPGSVGYEVRADLDPDPVSSARPAPC